MKLILLTLLCITSQVSAQTIFHATPIDEEQNTRLDNLEVKFTSLEDSIKNLTAVIEKQQVKELLVSIPKPILSAAPSVPRPFINTRATEVTLVSASYAQPIEPTYQQPILQPTSVSTYQRTYNRPFSSGSVTMSNCANGQCSQRSRGFGWFR